MLRGGGKRYGNEKGCWLGGLGVGGVWASCGGLSGAVERGFEVLAYGCGLGTHGDTKEAKIVMVVYDHDVWSQRSETGLIGCEGSRNVGIWICLVRRRAAEFSGNGGG